MRKNASSALATVSAQSEPARSATAGRSSVVEFVLEDVACRIELLAVDRRRKLAAYDVVLANKRSVALTCRLYGLERDERTTNIATFDTAPNALGRSRFFVPLGRRSRWDRVFVEIAGEGTALLFETRLPGAAVPVAPLGRTGLIGISFGTLALALVLFLIVMHATQPATVDRTAVYNPLAVAVAVAVAVPKAPPALERPAGAPGYVPIDDSETHAGAGFTYVGSWQHIKDMHDGRSEGTSSRSYHPGDRATFTFNGERFKLYGVKGPTGGYAELSIDADPRALVLFYAPKKQAGAEMFASPALRPGKHVVQLLVVDVLHGAGKRRYVNLDGAAYLAR